MAGYLGDYIIMNGGWNICLWIAKFLFLKVNKLLILRPTICERVTKYVTVFYLYVRGYQISGSMGAVCESTKMFFTLKNMG